MKKHPTLEELVKERGLKPTYYESTVGRLSNKVGFSYVVIYPNKTYDTFKTNIGHMENNEVILVRG